MNKLRNAICVVLLQLVVKISNNQKRKWEVKTDGCFRTWKGIKFNILKPEPEMIRIEDIAKGLAYKPHFSGFSPRFFSIAEHCLLVEKLVAKEDENNYHARLEALLHDASEAYTGDMIKPLKNLLPNFVIIEKRIQEVIYKMFSIIPKGNGIDIKKYDNIAQDVEASAFVGLSKACVEYISYLPPDTAYRHFMCQYRYLTNEIASK